MTKNAVYSLSSAGLTFDTEKEARCLLAYFDRVGIPLHHPGYLKDRSVYRGYYPSSHERKELVDSILRSVRPSSELHNASEDELMLWGVQRFISLTIPPIVGLARERRNRHDSARIVTFSEEENTLAQLYGDWFTTDLSQQNVPHTAYDIDELSRLEKYTEAPPVAAILCTDLRPSVPKLKQIAHEAYGHGAKDVCLILTHSTYSDEHSRFHPTVRRAEDLIS